MRVLRLPLFVTTLVACGGGATQVAVAPKVAVEAAAPAVATKPQLGYPEGLVGWGRIAHPDQVIRAAAVWAKTPAAQLMEQVQSLRGGAGALLALDHPIEAALLADHGSVSNLRFAVSGTVKSVEMAKKFLAEEFVVETRPDGSFYAKPRGRKGRDADADDAEDPTACVLHGDAHLVCGSEGSLSVLDPFLAHVVPSLPTSAAIHAESNLSQLDFGNELGAAIASVLDTSTSTPIQKKWLADLLVFYKDVDVLAVDGALDVDRVRVEATATLGHSKSMLAQAIAATEPVVPSPAVLAVADQADMTLFAKGGPGIVTEALTDLMAAGLATTRPTDEQKATLRRFVDVFSQYRSLSIGYTPAGLVRLADAAVAPKATAQAKARLESAVRTNDAMWIAGAFRIPFADAIKLAEDPSVLPFPSTPNVRVKWGKDEIAPVFSGSAFPSSAYHRVSHSQVFEPTTDKTKDIAKAARPIGTKEMHLVLVPIGDETWAFIGGELPVLENLYRAAAAAKPTPPMPVGLVARVTMAVRAFPMTALKKVAGDPAAVRMLLNEQKSLVGPPIVFEQFGATVTGRPQVSFHVEYPRETVEAILAFQAKLKH